MDSNPFYEFVAAGYRDTSEVPRGRDLYYRCRSCGEVIPSTPRDSASCTCRAVLIDTDAHRLVVRDLALLEVVQRR